jgi:aspartate/methionine/tyrosine aminotransferase
MHLNPFRIEQFYGQYEFTTRLMLSSSDAQSRTVADLLALEPEARQQLDSLWLGYTESSGSPTLRQTIAGMYQHQAPENILTLAAAEEGIFIVLHALLSPADHAIIETPCYESALEVTRSTGAAVEVWQRHFEDGWAHDLLALEKLFRPNTKLVYINTPSNPTGINMKPEIYTTLLEMCEARGVVLFCDEVYRELEHDTGSTLPAACDLSKTAVSLGSVSKAYGLPGLRTGWLASQNHTLLQKCLDFKLYTSICSPAPAEFLSDLALRHRHVMLSDNRAIVQRNLLLLQAFIERHSNHFAWVAPNASPICFPRLTGLGNVREFCERLAQEKSVLLLPGEVYDMPNHVRIGYGRENMPQALGLLEEHISAL